MIWRLVDLWNFLSYFGIWHGLCAFLRILRGRPKIIKIRDPLLEYYTWNDRSLFYHCINSTTKMKALVDSIPDSTLGTAVDIGANVGLFSLFLRQRYPSCRIVAIEANPNLAEVIRLNLAGDSDSTVVGKALVASPCESAVFYDDEQSSQIGSVLKDAVRAFSHNEIREHRVGATTPTELFEGLGHVDLLKVDIQGLEYEVFNDHRQVFRKVDFAIFEICFKFPGALEFLDLLRKEYPFYKVVSPVVMGADILFSRR